MSNYSFYMEKGDMKDATEFYVNIIRQAAEENGHTTKIVNSLKEIGKNDVVVTIQAKAWLKAKLLKPGHRTINWYQGIPPEEMDFLIPNRLKYYIWRIAWTIFEILALRFCDFNIFVSEAMQKHFKKKYGYTKDNYFLMPCFNDVLDESTICKEHYENPSFVYAGGLQKWQCFDKTLDLFKKIQEIIPNATLTIFTGAIEQAKAEMSKRGINGEAKYVPYQELNKEMSKIKYGFLIREDNEVNRVATPTKMSSYLASGVIPVFSTVIHDFDKNLECYKYIIGGACEDEILRKILFMEHGKVILKDIMTEYKQIFGSYYSKNHYVNALKYTEAMKLHTK